MESNPLILVKHHEFNAALEDRIIGLKKIAKYFLLVPLFIKFCVQNYSSAVWTKI